MAVSRVLSIVAVVALAAASGCGGDVEPPADVAKRPPVRSASRSRVLVPQDYAPCNAENQDVREDWTTWVGGTWAKSGGVCLPIEPPKIPISGRLVDADDRPMADARIRLWSAESQKNARTDETGAFELTTDVERATYDVDVILEKHAAEAAGRRRIHVGTLQPGDSGVVLRAPISQPVRSLLADGVVVDEDGAALVDWHVLADAVVAGETTNNCVASGVTDADGRFRIASWERADVALVVEDPDHLGRRIESQTVDPATGVVRIVMSSPDLIAGRVVAEHGGDVRGAVVHLRRVGDDVERTAVVDAAGEFVFKRLDAKSFYRLSVECAGYVEEPHEGDCSVDQLEVRLYLAKAEGVLAGRVVDSSSSALRSAWLKFVALDGGLGFQLMTEEDGSFRTYEARDIEYDVHVLAPAADGRLVPGAAVGRCRGGATSLLFRAAR